MPQVFIADDGVGAGLGRSHLDHVFIAGNDLDIDVGRLQGEAVVVVHRRQVDLVFLQNIALVKKI